MDPVDPDPDSDPQHWLKVMVLQVVIRFTSPVLKFISIDCDSSRQKNQGSYPKHRYFNCKKSAVM